MTKPDHEWSRGTAISVSFSCPSGLLDAIEKFGRNHMIYGVSRIIRRLLRYGLIYDKILLQQEQDRIEAKEKAKAKRSKKAKRKTPSKTK